MPAKKAVPAKKATPAKKAAPARKAPAKKAAPARSAKPAKPARPAKPAARTTATRSMGLPKPATKRGASRAPASRPATSNRPRAGSGGRSAGPGSRVRTGMGRPVWVLASIGVVLALLVLPYVQKWMVQRQEITAVRAENERARADVAALEAERRRWQDPDYVKAQARERLFYVMPGETGYVVVDSGPEAAPPSDPARAAAAKVKDGERPWFGDLWESLKVAGDPPADR